jgi:hypothetical protein
LQLTCAPPKVTLCCRRPTSQTKVRVRTSDAAAGVEISAKYAQNIAHLDLSDGKTDANGVLDVFVRCAEDAPCPSETKVTLDAAAYDNCELIIKCINCDKKAGPEDSERVVEDDARQAFTDKNYQLASNDASRAAKTRIERAGQRLADQDACANCEDYFNAAEDYERARDAQLKLGNQNAANEFQKNADEAFAKAAEACEKCASQKLERAKFDGADADYERAIKASKKVGRDSSRAEKAKKLVRLFIKQYLHDLGLGPPLTSAEEKILHGG